MTSWLGRSFLCAVGLLVLAAVVVLAGQGQASAQEADPPGTFKGRTLADVMSYRGAPWLEREDREAEERPSALLEHLPLEAGDVAVDMGCGSGYYARRMATRVGKDGRVLCVDIQPEMLEIAKRLAEQESLDNIDYVLGEAADPKLPEAGVDLIVLVDVYHEFSEPAAMLEAMRAALKPDGIVALAEYRLEGETAAWIKISHRMSVEQVKAEWLPAGFELVELIEDLPTQHLFLFRKAR